MEDIIIAINLSAVQLSDKSLISYIQQCLMKYEVSPRNIELELTETALLDDDPNKVHFDIIHQLSNMGFKLALDDFGTGFSSVSHLQRFPITVVKIDKSLMIDFENAKTNILIRALVLMLKKLDLEIVAEGIETQECFNLCEELAIDRAQGFHLALPVNIPTIEKLFIDGVQNSH